LRFGDEVVKVGTLADLFVSCLGSPVGRWAGYLLLQHKEELGGNRYIEKVRVFKPPGASLPYLLFYVAKDPWVGDVKPAAGGVVDERNLRAVVGTNEGVKNVVRQHVIFLQP
jgi:hypothetical protein